MFFYYLRDALQLLLSPKRGWEDVSYDDFNMKSLLICGFIPWIAIVSCSELIRFAYLENCLWIPLIASVLCTFLKYFISYFIAGFAFSVYVPSITHGAGEEQIDNTVIIYGLGVLALLDLVKNCLPVDLAFLNFYPLYVLYILWRSERYIKVLPGERVGYVLLCLFGVVLQPIMYGILFSFIIPNI